MKFTTWPEETFAEPESELVLAIVGDDPFGRVLERTFARERVRGRKVAIRRLPIPNRRDYKTTRDYQDAIDLLRQELPKVHLAYFPECTPEQFEHILDGADTSYLLTVGDRYECATRGAALALDRDGDRIIFYANVREIESLNVQVSSRLLSLAKIIK